MKVRQLKFCTHIGLDIISKALFVVYKSCCWLSKLQLIFNCFCLDHNWPILPLYIGESVSGWLTDWLGKLPNHWTHVDDFWHGNYNLAWEVTPRIIFQFFWLGPQRGAILFFPIWVLSNQSCQMYLYILKLTDF